MTNHWHINREYEGIEISFDGKPSEEIRNKMKAVGFKWSSAQMKWYAKDNDRTRKVANELATQGEEVGERLSFEQKMEREKERAERRQERLGARAGKLESVAEQKLEQAHKMANVIPFGQPILVGHHSEGRDRRYRERIHGTFEKGFEAMHEAEATKQRLEGSQALSRKRESPGYMSRKIDQLEADRRKLERDKEYWKDKAEWEERIKKLDEQITYWKKELGEAGGLRVTPTDVKAGDEILYLGTWYEVVRVNPKTVTIKNWLNIPTWTWGAEYSKIREVRHKSYIAPLEPKVKTPDAEFEKAKLFLSSLAMARTLDELIGWQPAVKRWSIKFPELEKELESEYQARFDYLKAFKDTAEADRKEKASKPQSEQAKELYKQMRKINSVRELDNWRNRVLFEAHLPDVEEDILLRDLSAKWRVYLETRGIPALEKFDKLPLDFKDEDYYFGTEVTVHPTTTIMDDVPWNGIIHEARNGGELWEVARAGYEAEGTSRIPIERLYVTKVVVKPKPRYRAPVKVDTSSKDYKSGYNLAIQGRIAPAVPAWTDQGQADFAQGYKDGQVAKTRKENEELLAKERAERSRLADIETGDRVAYEYELNQLPHHLHKEIDKETASVLGVGKDDRNYHARYIIALGKMRDFVRRYVPGAQPVFGQKPIESPVMFGTPNFPIITKPRVLGAPSRQEQTERELRAKAQEGKKFRGQVTLFGAVSTSRRLGEFEVKEKPIILQQPVKSMAEEQAKADDDVEEERHARELANRTIAEITIRKLKKQISYEQQRL